jgi:hypothetical protein
MTSLSKEILKKIQEDEIVPKPKWQFSFREGLFWFLWGVTLFFGTVSFSLILFFAINHDIVLDFL